MISYPMYEGLDQIRLLFEATPASYTRTVNLDVSMGLKSLERKGTEVIHAGYNASAR